MAYRFDDASSEYLSASAPVANEPLTMACWFRSDTSSPTNQCLMSVGNKSSETSHHALRIRDPADSDLMAVSRWGGTNIAAFSSAQWSTDTWHHACGVYAADNDRRIYLDGGNKGTDTTTVTVTVNDLFIGAQAASSTRYYMSGDIAEAAIWNVALTDDEAASLGSGCSPLLVRPASLVFYQPLRRNSNDIVGKLAITENNTPSIIDDRPPIIYPPSPKFFSVPAPASGGNQTANGSPTSVTANVTTGTASTDAVMTHHMGIGALADTSIKYRARLDRAGDVSIEYSTSSDLSGSTESAGVTVSSDDDFTGGEEITGLSANTTYHYSIKVDGTRAHSSTFPTFKTAPAEGVDASIKIAFASCMDDGDEATIFPSIAGETPLAFLQLGDFGYPDTTNLTTQRNNYKTNHDDTEEYYSDVVYDYPVERCWDDHDYGPNDSDKDASGKANSLQAFKEFTAHHDLANASNGIWRKWKWANAEFFMLDVRYQREPNNTGARFPASSTNTADTGSSGSTLVLRSADSPSASDDFYNGYYVKAEGVIRRVTDYVGATRTCTLSAAITGLDSSTTYFLREQSMLDGDALASDNQLDWLIDGVNNSTARWKIIVSASCWNPTEGTDEDTWGSYDDDDVEQDYIIQQITADNVIVLTGDRHFGAIDDGTNSNWPEISASPLTRTNGTVTGTWSQGTDNTGHMYGTLEIDGSAHTATLTVKDANGTTTASVTPLVVNAAAASGSVPAMSQSYRRRRV